MKNVIKFLLFITYSSSVFFLSNNTIILFLVPLNLFIMIIAKVYPKKNYYEKYDNSAVCCFYIYN